MPFKDSKPCLLHIATCACGNGHCWDVLQYQS